MKKYSLYPDIFSGQAKPRESSPTLKLSEGAYPRPVRRRIRTLWLVLSSLLPFAALWTAHGRFTSMSGSLVNMMSVAYENRFGAKVPDPLAALRAKSLSAADQDRPVVIPLHVWLPILDRISGQAAAAGLRLDVVSLNVARIEMRGSSADLQSVAQWVSGLSSDPSLADAALVQSEPRLSDKRTAFLVRARIRAETDKSSS